MNEASINDAAPVLHNPFEQAQVLHHAMGPTEPAKPAKPAKAKADKAKADKPEEPPAE